MERARMTALRKPIGMTVADFQAWQPEEHPERRWQLFDGEPVCMAPASENHGRIQGEAAFLLTAHLRERQPGCDVVVAPGVVPRLRSNSNHRIPDLGVTCSPPSGGQVVSDPVLLIEILSPSIAALTRENFWAYATVPSVAEILLLGSVRVEAELLRRGRDASWPEAPLFLGAEDDLELASIGFRGPLRAFYRTTDLLTRR
jgi:Uma2 family endonuclease